jgi:bacillithiol system protein YtxJ
MNWIPLTSSSQLTTIRERSYDIPCLIFKHSTSCNISAIAKYRLEDDWSFEANQVEPYYLDLLACRPVSQQVAEDFEVYHESPQVILLVNGECVYDASHLDITVAELEEQLDIIAAKAV